jgi:glycosyltransferase involved in cell wall biosynthesis
VPGILIDVMRLVYQRLAGAIPTGIDRVGLEYLRHYGGRARAVLSLGPLAAPLSPRDSSELFRSLLDPSRPGFARLYARLALKSVAWDWIRPGAGSSILFNTSTLWLDWRHYAAQLRWLGARPVIFVHDLIPLSHPEYFRAGEDRLFDKRLRNALALARGIVVNSRDTANALMGYAAQRGLRCPPVAVAPLAPSVRPPARQLPRPEAAPYFVMLGTIEPRKNHLLLLHLWRSLAAELGARAPRLYVVGQRGWECENVVDLLERSAALKGLVIERNACGDAELGALLQHAQALLMPSFAEGYGLPVAEALAAGVPVIASDLPAFREIAGEVPEYAEPIDGARWRALVLDYARADGALRPAQLERLRAFRPTTWEQHFAAVDRFIETLP